MSALTALMFVSLGVLLFLMLGTGLIRAFIACDDWRTRRRWKKYRGGE